MCYLVTYNIAVIFSRVSQLYFNGGITPTSISVDELFLLEKYVLFTRSADNVLISPVQCV